MKNPETELLRFAISSIYGEKTPKKIKRLLRQFDDCVVRSRKTLTLHRVDTNQGVLLSDDRGYVLDGLVSITAKVSSPEDIDTVLIEISADSKSLEGI